MPARVVRLTFDRSRFPTTQDVRAWCAKHDFRSLMVRSKKRAFIVKLGDLGNDEGREAQLAPGVRALLALPEDEPVVGKIGRGAAPMTSVAPLPDFTDIYFQPENNDNARRERKAEQIRRRTSSHTNREKFGLHGVTSVKPAIRYEPGEYTLVVRGPRNNQSVLDDKKKVIPPTPKVEGRTVSGRNPRLVVRESSAVGGRVKAKKMD